MNLRAPHDSAAVTYDLVIVGGGIYGTMLALEAARRRLRPLLLERDDFGAATSWNSLRIVHGGLRYLQSADLHRFHESVGERAWFLRNFPDLVRPLPCLMPLYGDGLRRPGVMRAALAANDLLSRRRNRGMRPDRALPPGQVLAAAEVAELFPGVDAAGLRGGALWHDGVMRNSQRLLVEALRWAASYGATLLNYVEVVELVQKHGRVAGVRAVDRETGERWEYRTPVVINCAGPWSGAVARRLDAEVPGLFRPSLAFNLLLDRDPPSRHALALAPRAPGARTYFLHPWQGRVLAGTYHAPWSEAVPDGAADAESATIGPSEEQLARCLADLSAAVPGWRLTRDDVLRVHAGLLPAAAAGTDRLAVREVIHDHGMHGGPHGLWSVSGVKFTTARLVAEKALRAAFPGLSTDPGAVLGTERPIPVPVPRYDELATLLETDPARAAALVARLARDEMVVRPADLVLRRTDWGTHPAAPADLDVTLAELLQRHDAPTPYPSR